MAQRSSPAGASAQRAAGADEVESVLPLVDADDRVAAALLEVDLDEDVAVLVLAGLKPPSAGPPVSPKSSWMNQKPTWAAPFAA